ncbi:hypothetical protein [Streptomyces sp. NPDC049879]|uniref:hypothetical protein n=1 Tax=Streptomyces sp. NPDC049879 TaxID=3365598 RepID=UPI0037AB79C0
MPDPHEPDLGPAPTSTARSADPADVARRYLTASRGAGDGAAPRAAEAYMDPANPERGHGQQWEPPPPPGTIRQAERVELTETARSADRVVYRANYQLVERRGRRRTARTEQTASLVCARQPDGHWLVLRDAPLLHPAP